MRSTQVLTTSVVGLAALLAACADAPTMAPLAPAAPSSPVMAVSIGDQATFGTVATERFRVCKVGSSASFSYAIDYVDGTLDEAGTFDLSDGQCAEVAQKGGTGANVSVTETSAQTGFILDHVDVTTASGAACASFTTSTTTSAGPTASGLISGTAGGSIPCRGILATFYNVAEPPPPPPPPAGCTLTIGYWKTHAGFTGNNADVVTQYLPIWLGTSGGAASTQVSTATQAVSVLSMTGGASNGIVKLKAQLLGAKLNIASGASAASVSATIAAADAFLATNAASSWSSLPGATKAQVNAWMTTLDNYNNGLVGPGHCGTTGGI